MQKPIISIIMPCYNEAENLENLMQACYEINSPLIEFILVDNGSTDNTQEILKKLVNSYPLIKIHHVQTNKGYGFGILEGLKIADSPYIGWTHADLQTHPRDSLKALDIIRSDTSKKYFIKGKRSGRNTFDLFFTICMSILNTIILRTPMRDINAQPTIFPKTFFESWENPPHDFSLDLYTYYFAKKQNLTIKRIPVHFGKRTSGEAHLKNIYAKLKYSIQSFKYSLSIKF